jgi:hypothetical protein
MARADRTRAFVMPAAAVQKLLASEPDDPALARVRQPEQEQAMLPRQQAEPDVPQVRPRSEARMRQHLEEMQQLMDFMLEEMDSLEQGR